MITLQEIMSPKSIAIVGASDNKARIGGRPLAHMIEQKFSGGIFPINPNRDTVQGIKAYPSLLDVKDDLDFILVAVPSNIVVSVLEEAVIKNAKTAKELIDKNRMQKEIEIVGEIQKTLLSENKNEEFPIAGINIPAKVVSGDFYNFSDLGNNKFGFGVADVSGKGIKSSLLMSKASSLYRCLSKTIFSASSLSLIHI